MAQFCIFQSTKKSLVPVSPQKLESAAKVSSETATPPPVAVGSFLLEVHTQYVSSWQRKSSIAYWCQDGRTPIRS